MFIKYIKLSDNAITPKQATTGAAAYDLYIPTDFTVPTGRCIIPLDFAIELPVGFAAEIRPRSGFSAKGMEDITGARRDADVLHGLIDSDYRGSIGVIISNHTAPFTLAKGTRIAQLEIRQVQNPEFILSDSLTHTQRQSGGFGSTGK